MAGSNLMYELANGNLGAWTVVSQLDYAHLEQLNHTEVRGSMIWVGYKDICKQDIEAFKRKLSDGSLEVLVMATPDWKYANASLLENKS